MPPQRLDFIDNMRLSMIVLVLAQHAAVTYSGLGGWYYKEPATLSLATFLFFATYQCFMQAFFMGALFMLAGYFAAASLDRKGPAGFIKGRLIRLGLPTLFYMLVINPLTVYYLMDWDHTRFPAPFPIFYEGYVLKLHFLGGTGPMWFALALLVFCVVFALLPAGKPRTRPTADISFPRMAFFLAACTTAGAFLIRVWWPIGTSVLNMQLCYFAQYVILFLYGIAAHRNGWLLSIPYATGRRFVLLALTGIPVLLALIAASGALGYDKASSLGGWHWQSLVFSAWESCTGVLLSLGLPTVLREKWNSREGFVGRLPDFGFAVYMFHPPVLVLLAVLLRPLEAGPLEKFLLLCAVGIPVSFGVGWLVRSVPGLKELVRA